MAVTTSKAHRLYVKALYKRYLTNALNWAVHRDVWREQAMEIRAEFDKHRNESDLKAVGKIIAEAEAKLVAKIHPDPYISAKFPGGTGWERNLPPPPNAFIRYELDGKHHEHHEPEAVEDLGVLTEYEERTGGRLSPQARQALADLAANYHNQRMYAEMLNNGSDRGARTGKSQESRAAAEQQGVDLSELEANAEASTLTPEERKAFLQDITDGVLHDSLNMQAIGVLEQEASDARDAKDGITGR